MIIITIDEVKRRIKEKFPEQPFEILEYTRMTKPFKVKCLKCGEISSFSSVSNFLYSNRKGVCFCYNENNAKTKHKNNKNKILEIIKSKEEEMEFIKFGYQNDSHKFLVSVKCKKCNQIYTKTFQSFLNNSECYFCSNKQKMNTQAYRSILPEEYELLSEYKNTDTKVLIKHKCGFIWPVSPHSLVNYIGCPKCNHKRSKGERKIERFLNEKKVIYSIEQSFDWQTNLKRRYDFYLPEYNLVIEYMGEQHYRDRKEFFGISLEEQQKIDAEKKQDALKAGLNYLDISYKNYNRIEEILSEIISSTTIM